MDEKMRLRRRMLSVMIVFLAVIIPGYVRLFSGNAFASVRDVDVLQLLATGIFTGILIMTAKDYFKMKKGE